MTKKKNKSGTKFGKEKQKVKQIKTQSPVKIRRKV